ncbi:protein of unknown function DUF112 transmembrane [Pseudodesulfovibrio mercurii]|uniref:DUF112 domain-containing protein n=1 Tax=Pseudodesulfovibrio mercurii TaxID=641491 RepID=F0JIC3_9BACT|nr:tripartite tricarboxylate transporter permease [Pseudodesulfovibrio mercurii]EGB14175.1 protein of unknown function DUF112 transmembrane [Pseudodesulfovibrio mercurii]
MDASILNGIFDAFNIVNISYVFVGVALGVIVGGIPGLSGPIAIAMVIPITYFMPAVGAIGFLVGINKGGCFGGSITAILLNTPGAPEATATTFDGYPLAQSGKAGKALKVSLLSSVIGDLFSTCLVIAIASPIASIALKMGPAEIAAILILALTMIALLESESFLKGIIASCFGLFFSTVGMEPVASQARFSFGIYQLESGLSIGAMAIGMLAAAEIVRQAIELNKEQGVNLSCLKKEDKKNNNLSVKELISLIPTWLRSSLVGSFIGTCPGLGSTVACFMSYGIAKKMGKPGEKYGTGEIKGVAAPEAANNAVVGSSLIPLFTLGIPGSVAASLLVGAFVIHGITPGPLMFEEHGREVYSIYGCMIVGNIAVLILGYLGIKIFVKVLEVPKQILYPIILFTCVVGTYIMESDPFYAYVMVFFMIIGFLMKITEFPFVSFVIGFVLGGSLEISLQQTLIMSSNHISVLFTRPISGSIMATTMIAILYSGYKYFRQIRITHN